MDKIHSQRLTNLADALEHDQHGHVRWDFGFLIRQGKCGTVGCALGACPHIFPKDWKAVGGYKTVINGFDDSRSSAREFFGITSDEYDRLFTIFSKRYILEQFKDEATPQQVAANIRAFLELKRREV